MKINCQVINSVKIHPSGSLPPWGLQKMKKMLKKQKKSKKSKKLTKKIKKLKKSNKNCHKTCKTQKNIEKIEKNTKKSSKMKKIPKKVKKSKCHKKISKHRKMEKKCCWALVIILITTQLFTDLPLGTEKVETHTLEDDTIFTVQARGAPTLNHWRLTGGTGGFLEGWNPISTRGGDFKVARRKSWISNKKRNKSVRTKNGNRGGGVKQTLRLDHWNAGNGWWEHKRGEIQALVLETNPDLLFVSEANLRANTPPEKKDIEGYHIISPNTELSLGYSRLILLVRDGVQLNVMEDCMSNEVPVIWVKLVTRGRKQIVIGSIYREFHLLLQQAPNNTDDMRLQLARWRKSVSCWKKAARNAKCILLGDLNLDYCKWDDSNYRNNKMIQHTKDEIETMGFCQLVKDYTRHWPGQPSSIVDHVWTNNPASLMSIRNLVRASSDHNLLSTVVRTKDRQELCHDMERRDRKEFNITRYKEKIKNIDWTMYYECEDINKLNEFFVDKVGKFLEEEAPLKIFQARKNHKNWINTNLKNEMIERDNKRELARLTGDPQHWADYRKCRNKCTKTQQKTKNDFYRNIYKTFENEHDTKNIYRTTKNLLNWETGGAPKTFLVEGKLFRRPIDLANLQQDYFTTKIRKLILRLPATGLNPLSWLNNAMESWTGKGKFPTFKFKEVSLIDTVKYISTLSNSTTFGTDNIDALSIKAAALYLAPPIKHLINTSLKTSKFANKWKLAKLVPLLKANDLNRMLPDSYRPIAILPTLSKLVERAAQRQILEHFEEHKLLNDNGHAYRMGYSTTTTLLEITDKIFKAIDANQMSSIMTVDQSAAFDCVSHNILIDKLKIYNLSRESLKWISSYLEARTQFVKIGRAESRMHPVDRGVPQGSVLGPLLYSIYTNDMSESIVDKDCRHDVHKTREKLFGAECPQCGTITQYADDSTYQISNKHRQPNQRKLSEVIGKLKIYLNTNELTINMDKTKLMETMIKQKKGRTPGTPPELIILNNKQQLETLTDSKQCRILGMNLQSNATWNAHLEIGRKSLLPSLRKNLGALRHLGKQIPAGCKNTLARGMILSRISYLISIWGGTSSNLLRKAQTVQNASARWVTGLQKRTKISTLLEATGWYSVKEMTLLSSTTLLWKMINKNTPRRLSEELDIDRTTLLFTIKEPRLQFTRQNFIYRASKEWNTLPDNIRQNRNIGSFKNQMKTWVKEQRTKEPD